ncbi:MAG: amidohydrolase family protein [Pseudomonadota bacterium]
MSNRHANLNHASAIVGLSATLIVLSGCSWSNTETEESRAITLSQENTYKVLDQVPAEKLEAYTGASVIDGTGSPPIENATLFVHEGKILGVIEDAFVPNGAKLIDVSGKWIVPGLIDAHVHFFESGRSYASPRSIDLTELVSYDEEARWTKNRLSYTLTRYLCSGVTGALSAGGPQIERDARSLSRQKEQSPRVYAAFGPVAQVPSQMVLPPFAGENISFAASIAELESTMNIGFEWDADLVKTAHLGGAFTEFETDASEFHKELVRIAHENGKPVTTHIFSIAGLIAVLPSKPDSLQHLPLDGIINDDLIGRIKETGLVVVPTLSVFERTFGGVYDKDLELTEIENQCGDPQVIRSWNDFPDELPASIQQSIAFRAPMFATAKTNMMRLYAAGIPIAAGTDAGNIGLLHGASMHLEMKLLAEFGMKPLDVIQSATLNSARVAGQSGLVGSLEPQKKADFLILSENPLDNISNMQSIEYIVIDGNKMGQSQLRAGPTD